MKQISVRVDDELREAIDKARGQIPREAWMRTVLAAATEVPDTHRKIVHMGSSSNTEAQRAHLAVMAERQRNLEKARKR